MTDTSNGAEAPESTRETKTVREYFNALGESSKRPPADVAAVRITFKPTGEVIDQNLDKLPASMVRQLAAWGWMTNVGNCLGKKSTENAQAAFDRAELFANGEWAEAAGEGGPSPTMLAEAAYNAGAAAGKSKMNNGDDFTLENVTKLFKTYDASKRKDIKALPDVAAAYLELEMKKTKERLAAAKKAAKEAKGVDGAADSLSAVF